LLQDGDLTIRLKGSYDPGTGNWSVSAKSSIIVYTLDGSVDRAGVSRGSSATIAVKSGEEWVPYIFPVAESTAVSISGAGEDGVAGWLPAFAYGSWHISSEGGGYSQTMTCIISDWKIKVTGTTTTPDGVAIPFEQTLTVIEYGGSGSTFDALCCYPEYVADAANLAKAFAAYLGIGDIRVLTEEEEPVTGTLMPPGKWIYMDSSDSLQLCGFTEAEYNKLNVFWSTGGWEIWAAANGVTPGNRYEKYKVSFPNNTTMDVTQMVEVGTGPWNYTYSFDSLAALKLATLVEVSEVMSFTR
jgi:hypothetical protein